MVDAARSRNMSRIRGKNTKPEHLLRQALWARGLRYRLHYRTSAGKPDLVFVGKRVAVFIDGCFWHGCPDHYVRPRSRNEFWAEKLATNVARDQRQTAELERAGWTVLRFWEHEVRSQCQLVADNVEQILSGQQMVGHAHWVVHRVDAISDDGEQEHRFLTTVRDPTIQEVVERRRTTAKGWQ